MTMNIADVNTLEVRQLADLTVELAKESLSAPTDQDRVKPHFKAAFTGHGRLVVGNNTYENDDHLGTKSQGRLAEWDGHTWTIIDTAQYNEITGRTTIGDSNPFVGQPQANLWFGKIEPAGIRRDMAANRKTCRFIVRKFSGGGIQLPN